MVSSLLSSSSRVTMEEEFGKVCERWRIYPQDLDLGKVISEGSFGKIRAGSFREGNKWLKAVVKQVSIANNAPIKDWHKLLHEAIVVWERCKFTCRLYGICLLENHFCLVMKAYETSLDKELNNYPDRKAPQQIVNQWMLDICKGVAELHAENIILGDLRLTNILLDKFGDAIMGEFGISKTLGNSSPGLQIRTHASVLAYMAPEIMDNEMGAITMKADIWALGCLLLELLTGTAPWEGFSTVQIITEVCSKRNSPFIPNILSCEYIDMLNMCFVHEATQRASAMDILKALAYALENEARFTTPTTRNVEPSHPLVVSQDKCPASFMNIPEEVHFTNLEKFPAPSEPSADVGSHSDTNRMTAFEAVSPLISLISRNRRVRKVVLSGHEALFLLNQDETGEIYIEKLYPSPPKLLLFPEALYKITGRMESEEPVVHALGPRNTLYVGARKRGEGSSYFILVFHQEKYMHAITHLRGKGRLFGSSSRYTSIAISQSGNTLFLGCNDGVIEVWRTSDISTFSTALNTHSGRAITLLAADKNDTVYSVGSKSDKEVVRVFTNSTQVGVLNAGGQISSMCVVADRLYIIAAVVLWCDIASLELFSMPRGPAISKVFDCRPLRGFETVVFCGISFRNTVGVEAWWGGECVASEDTGLEWPGGSGLVWSVGESGVVCIVHGSVLHRWKFIQVS